MVTLMAISAQVPVATLQNNDESDSHNELSHAEIPIRAVGVTYHTLTPKLNPSTDSKDAPVVGMFMGCDDKMLALSKVNPSKIVDSIVSMVNVMSIARP